MVLSGEIWTATVDLEPGTNEFEVTVVDTCGTVGTTTFTLTRLLSNTCGDGVIDAFETCDDGNQADGDCCSSACLTEPDGSPCDDGELCTLNDTCNAGTCTAGQLGPQSCGNASFCYSARRSRGSARGERITDVSVRDVVDERTYDLKRTDAICVAAAIDGEAPPEPSSHHLSYRIRALRSQEQNTTPGQFRVTTSQGSIDLETRGADRMLISAAMNMGSAPTPPAEDMADDYRCHRVRPLGRPGKPEGSVSVQDPFENRSYELRRSSRLCLAANLNGVPPRNPDLHFLCSSAKRARGEDAHDRVVGQIIAVDTFGEHAVDTRKESSLCVPATVQALP